MKKIQKTISLEPMTSRLPSVWPAYKDNKLYFFDDNSIKERQYEYPSNYGMIPLSFSFSNFKSKNYNLECNSADTISFERISEWYAFFRKYYHLLNDAGHCGKIYSSATEYYDYEIKTRYSDELIYGNEIETYEELDAKFDEIGGNSFYEWLCKNVIPTYIILSGYTEYWKTETLFYPDVIKWIGWLKQREYYETEANFTSGDTEHWNCKNSGITDCCDCEEYFNRGGKRTLDSMLEWYNAVQDNIAINNSKVKNDETLRKCLIPSLIDQIELENSLEDIGEYSILSPEYELGIDYRGAIDYNASGNTKGGTTVIVDGKTMILKNEGGMGFCFSQYYMDKFYNSFEWEDYTKLYINANPQEFVSSAYTYYAFDNDDRFYSASTSGDVISAMSSGESYSIIETDAILLGNTIIQVEKTEYGTYSVPNDYLSGRTYFVYREKETNTPYTLINGKKTYGEWSIEDNSYHFPFFDTKYGRKPNDNELSFITYDGNALIVEDSGVTINGVDYIRIDGYCYDNDGHIYYVSGTSILDESLNETEKATINESDDKVLFDAYNENVIIYNAAELTGRTSSKLASLAATNTLVDDVGNKINGIYKITNNNKYNHQPLAETELEPIYQVGNVSLIGKFKLTSGITEIGDSAVNYFIGNIITNMEFYYKDIEGNKTNASAECTSEISSLSAITQATSKMKASANTLMFDDSLYCDMKYYIGATLSRNKGESVYRLAENMNYGVEYNETVKFVKTPVQYQLRTKTNGLIIPSEENNPLNHSISYIVYTYELEQITEDIVHDAYGTITKEPMAIFKTEINLINEDLTSNFSKYSDMNEYNGINVSPIFKEEYKLGISSMEKVEGDIYIDRGINAAFEKHLKLGEVTSLEALENFGNNFFNIMNN